MGKYKNIIYNFSNSYKNVYYIFKFTNIMRKLQILWKNIKMYIIFLNLQIL